MSLLGTINYLIIPTCVYGLPNSNQAQIGDQNHCRGFKSMVCLRERVMIPVATSGKSSRTIFDYVRVQCVV